MSAQVPKENPEVKGLEQVIRRQEKARKIKQDKENFYNLKEEKIQCRDSSRVTKPEPFSLREAPIDNREILVNVDVRISKTKKGMQISYMLVRIALREGDDAKNVARNFARIHSLNAEMLKNLEEMLEEYLKQFSS